MPHEAPLRVRVEPIDGDFTVLAEAWRSLADRAADRSYALTPEWLEAWAATARRGELSFVRVLDDGDTDVAVGLLERLPGGRWRFAGGNATPQRRLLCAGAAEGEAWRAFWWWGVHHLPAAAECEAQGLPAGVPIPRGSRSSEDVAFQVALPTSFDEYLRERRPGTRRALKAKLRRLTRAGGTVEPVPVAQHAAALERFRDLHSRRAEAKGERHTQIDRRLTRLLAALPETADLRLRLLELRVGDVVAGVTVRLDHAGTGFFYNAGMDPDWARLSPGICLELASIRDAIDLGLHRFDLGPGDWRYKRDLGGAPEPRFRVVAPCRSFRGLAALLMREAHGRWTSRRRLA